MESRFQRIVLIALIALPSSPLLAQQRGDEVLKDIVSPDLERREIDEAKIDSENLEVGFFAGVLSVEDFGSNDVYGMRLGLHVTEFVFIESHLGVSTLQETSYELLSGETQLLTDEQRDLTYYNLSLGFNVFPGEIHLGRWAFHHQFYAVGGAGNTVFADNEYFTYHFGGGLRLFATDWLALRVDVKNHLMAHDLFGEEKQIQNLETHIGFSLFF